MHKVGKMQLIPNHWVAALISSLSRTKLLGQSACKYSNSCAFCKRDLYDLSPPRKPFRSPTRLHFFKIAFVDPSTNFVNSRGQHQPESEICPSNRPIIARYRNHFISSDHDSESSVGHAIAVWRYSSREGSRSGSRAWHLFY